MSRWWRYDLDMATTYIRPGWFSLNNLVGGRNGGQQSTRRVWDAAVDVAATAGAGEFLVDNLDPDGDCGSPVLDILLAATGQLGEESRSERVTMFWGLAGSACLYVDYYGGVEPKVVRSAELVDEGQQQGNAVGWAGGPGGAGGHDAGSRAGCEYCV